MNEPLRVMRILEGTSVDGPGLRTSIYFAGCNHRCPGCHNPHTWDFEAGTPMSVEEIMAIVRYNGFPVTFSGGDPLYQAGALLPIAQAVRNEGLGLWCYTGFNYEQLLADRESSVMALLKLVDVLVDGLYMADLRDTSLLFRGSSNQRLIDIQKSRRTGCVVLFHPNV